MSTPKATSQQAKTDIRVPEDAENIIKIVERKLSGYIKEIRYNPKGKLIELIIKDSQDLVTVASALKKLGFDHVKSITGVDYPNRSVIELMVHVGSHIPILRKYVLLLRCDLDRNNPVTDSLVDIWPSAEFQEREAWEMFGIVFRGHPDLRRILLPEEFEGLWPGRKDFKIP